MKRKKIVRNFLAIVFSFIMCTNVFAATVTETATNQANVLAELRQQMKEINEFMKQNLKPMDVENQTVKYIIPLSTGETAEYIFTMTQAPKPISRGITILDAKLGIWNFDSSLKLANHGTVKARTTVNITYVPSSSGSVPKFTAYNGTVSAIPDQYVSVDNTFAETTCLETNYDYKTSGYVGFNVYGIPANFYFTQRITYVDNMTNYNKLQVGFSGEF